MAQAVRDGLHEVLQLSLCRRQLTPGSLGGDTGFASQALPLGVERLDESLHRVRRHEIASQGGHYPTFEFAAADRAAVGTRPLEGIVAG